MPEFSNPFVGNDPSRPLSKEELVRAIRFAIASESEAVQLYQQIAKATEDALVIRVFTDVAREEQVHIGEFQTVLFKLAPEEEDAYKEGEKEVSELSGNLTEDIDEDEEEEDDTEVEDTEEDSESEKLTEDIDDDDTEDGDEEEDNEEDVTEDEESVEDEEEPDEA